MKEMLSLSEVSKILGVTTRTLRDWDYKGILKFERTSGGHRRLSILELKKFQGGGESSVTLVYARCSTQKQKDNLERQIGRLLKYCVDNGWKVELFEDIGSGLNENRKQYNKLLKRIKDKDVKRVVIEYRDRLTRFGYSLFEHYCKSYDVDILVINNEVKVSFEEEMTQDIISLITSYSARIYGKRGGRKQ